MKRELASIILAGIAASAAFAETAVLDFTYAEGELTTYGKGKKETIDVAICINEPSLAGMKVTGLKAYINTTEGISETSLWGSKELTVVSKKNVPDLFSYDVEPVSATVGEYNLGLLEVELSEPYVLGNEPLYLGYTLKVDDTTTEGAKTPIILSEGINPDGFFLHMEKSVLKWLDYSENTRGVAFIVASIEGDFPEYSLGFKSYETIYDQEDEDFNALFNVSNIGVNTINQVKYVYSIDGGNEVESTLDLDTPIAPGLANSAVLSLGFKGVSGYGPHDLQVEITEVNGQPNNSVASEISCVVNVVPFLPVKRPLVEEYTGLWCGWCPRGFLAMEMIAEDYGNDEVSICYHSGDAMQVTTSTPVSIPGYPSASIDRNSAIDPYYGSYDDREFGIGSDLLKAMDQTPLASLEVASELDGDVVNVKADAVFIQNIEDANYEIGYVLVCNGLVGDSWIQENYYAGESGYEGTPLEVLTTWPAKVTGLVFNDVAVDASAMMGVEGSLPSTLAVAQKYSHSYSFDIDENSLVQNRENLVVTAFIIDKSNGKVVNANKCAIGTAAVKGVEVAKTAVSTEYFDLTGRKVVNPANGLFIKVEKYSDGSRKASKILLSK